MDRHDPAPDQRPVSSAHATTDHGGAAAVVLLSAAAVVALLVLAALFMGNVLADAGDEPVQAREVDEGRLSDAAYTSVELATPKEAVLSALLPVLPVYSRDLDRFVLRGTDTVAAECVYYDRADGRAGQQYRFCFAEDLLVDATVLLAGDPGEGSAVVEEGL